MLKKSRNGNTTAGDSCNVEVMCRVRPLSQAEVNAGCTHIPTVCKDSARISVKGRHYEFDKVFSETACQEDVYKACAASLLDDVFKGVNATLFAYGMTSSGKTYTMEGVVGSEEQRGLIPRICEDLFCKVSSCSNSVTITGSYYEIYLDQIRDLLDDTRVHLSIHEDFNKVPFVQGRTERLVSSSEELLSILDEGRKRRAVAETCINRRSSRSHAIVQLEIAQRTSGDAVILSRLFLVDLAGSEKIRQTGAENIALDEAKKINQSLLALSQVVFALSLEKAFVPFRGSKLTRILQQSLGGNSRTVVILCVSPASIHEEEIKSTLDFGRRVKLIKNKPIVNQIADAGSSNLKRTAESMRIELEQIENELQRCRKRKRVEGVDTTLPIKKVCSGCCSLSKQEHSLLDAVKEETESLEKKKAELQTRIDTLKTLQSKARSTETQRGVELSQKLKLIRDLEKASPDPHNDITDFSRLLCDVVHVHNLTNLPPVSEMPSNPNPLVRGLKLVKYCLDSIRDRTS